MIRLPFFSAILLTACLTSCANFRKLGQDLETFGDDYRVSGVIETADARKGPVRAMVIEWDEARNQVYSADVLELTHGGAFAFSVKSPLNQHVAAYADENRDGRYTPGEPLWFHRGDDGKPRPVTLDAAHRRVRLTGRLSRAERAPTALVDAVTRAIEGRTLPEFISRKGVSFALGEKVNLDDPRFAATRGSDGLWTPATFATQGGAGIYFLERYDPAKIPVLFIHGAGGTPQDWRPAMEKLDRKTYQMWFYAYPSGMRLKNAAIALDDGVKALHDRYGFRRLHVVAHSMGGLVAREFVIRNAVDEQNSYINTLVTYSTPWDGHEAAAMGVKYAPKVIPSWRDMSHGSDFLAHLYDRRLKGRVNYYLFYSQRASRSLTLPAENDGSVSVASQTRLEALQDSVASQGFDEDHDSILKSKTALSLGKRALDRAAR